MYFYDTRFLGLKNNNKQPKKNLKIHFVEKNGRYAADTKPRPEGYLPLC